MSAYDETKLVIQTRRLDIAQITERVALLPALSGNQSRELMSLTEKLSDSVDELAAAVMNNTRLEDLHP